MAEGQIQEEEKIEEKKPVEILAKTKKEFKNVSQTLVDLIENPPSIDTNPDDSEEEEMKT